MAKVNWYENEVLLVVEKATDELLTKLALHVEGEAKKDAPVDTGFMRNAIYAITPLANQRAIAEAQARAAADRPMAPAPRLAEHGEAAVHGAAEYTIYQEMKVHFLYRALRSATTIAGGVIREVGRTWP